VAPCDDRALVCAGLDGARRCSSATVTFQQGWRHCW
jgi:hypothetical protein